MKTKLTGAFLVIGLVFVLVVFNFGKIAGVFRQSDEKQPEVSKELSLPEVNSFLKGGKWLDYVGTSTILDSKLFEPGQAVYVHLWASWCAPCLNEIPELIAFAKKNKDRVHFVLVSLDDSKEDLVKFLKSFPEMNDPLLSRVWDKDKKMSKFFDADRLPMTIVLDNPNSKLKFVRSVIDWKNL